MGPRDNRQQATKARKNAAGVLPTASRHSAAKPLLRNTLFNTLFNTLLLVQHDLLRYTANYD